MEDADNQRDVPLTEDRDGPLGKQGWHAGATFFAESGGEPAHVPEQGEQGGPGAGGGDEHLPASEAGAGIIPGEEGAGAGDTHRTASEAHSAPAGDEEGGEAQSWLGTSFGSIPPPG